MSCGHPCNLIDGHLFIGRAVNYAPVGRQKSRKIREIKYMYVFRLTVIVFRLKFGFFNYCKIFLTKVEIFDPIEAEQCKCQAVDDINLS